MKVLFFARARELAGAGEANIDLPIRATVAQLRVELVRLYPSLETLLPRCAIAVDDDYAEDAHVLVAESVVALLPPVSGGQDNEPKPVHFN